MIHHGNCLDVMATLAPDSVHAIVTDPPYGLSFMGKGWDTFDPSDMERRVGTRMGNGPASDARDGRSKGRTTSAFANPGAEAGAYDFTARGSLRFQVWCEEWSREALRVAAPGAHLLSFGGTRTVHRLTAGLEDAGWEIRDCLVWGYASGFPKSHNLDGEWDGWGTALKPAWEPIVMARKPLRGTVAANVAAHGTGALNIDGTRIASEPLAPFGSPARSSGGILNGTGEPRPVFEQSPLGRWPANVILTDPIFDGGIEGVVGGGPTNGGGLNHVLRRGATTGAGLGYGSSSPEDAAMVGYDDTGTYSRFFLIPKAGRSDREPVLGGLPEQEREGTNGTNRRR